MQHLKLLQDLKHLKKNYATSPKNAATTTPMNAATASPKNAATATPKNAATAKRKERKDTISPEPEKKPKKNNKKKSGEYDEDKFENTGYTKTEYRSMYSNRKTTRFLLADDKKKRK